jgi:hypothetical protein
MKVLVVVRNFGDYTRGQVITDKASQDKLFETHSGHLIWAEHTGHEDPALPAD